MAMETWLLAIVSSSTVIVFLMFLALILIYLTTSPYPELDYKESEKYYTDPTDGNQIKPFSSLKDVASLDLSLIIPAYNEEKRLPYMLNEAVTFLEAKCKSTPNFKYEIIIADDGSCDKTTQTGWAYSLRYGIDKIRVLTLHKNRGKGGAVRMGMLVARGRLLVYADADSVVKFSELDSLEHPIKHMSRRPDSLGVVCGSRLQLEKVTAKRSVVNSLLLITFYCLTRFLCVNNVRDCLCGFKLFTRTSARLIFRNMHVERWAFDVDVLYLANHFKIPVVEVPVGYSKLEGSKVNSLFCWLQMVKDLFLIRLRYTLGAWKIEPLHKLE